MILIPSVYQGWRPVCQHRETCPLFPLLWRCKQWPWTKEQNDKASFNTNSGKARDSYVKLKQGIALRLFNRAWNHFVHYKTYTHHFCFSLCCAFFQITQKCRCGRLHPPVPVHLPLPLHSRAVAAVYNGEVHQCCKVLNDHSEYECLGKNRATQLMAAVTQKPLFFSLTII